MIIEIIIFLFFYPAPPKCDKFKSQVRLMRSPLSEKSRAERKVRVCSGVCARGQSDANTERGIVDILKDHQFGD